MMFSFISSKLIFLGVIGVALAGAFGYYYYQMNSKNNEIIKLQNKSVVQKVKINNLNTKITVQKVNTKNKVFEAKEKQIKKGIKNVIKKHSDINSSIGSHSIAL